MMKKIKIAMLLGLFLISAECIIDDIVTKPASLSVSAKPRNGKRKRVLPKEHFCSEKKFQKLTCEVKSKTACKDVSATQVSPICAFDIFGQSFQFNRQCEACENMNIKYYFKGKCSEAPDICTKTEECVNGLCVEMLQSAKDSARVICNTKDDCPSPADMCVANKCIDKRELMNVMKEAENKNPKFHEKTEKMRIQVTKKIEETRKKGMMDLLRLKKVNAESKEPGTQKGKKLRFNVQNSAQGTIFNN